MTIKKTNSKRNKKTINKTNKKKRNVKKTINRRNRKSIKQNKKKTINRRKYNKTQHGGLEPVSAAKTLSPNQIIEQIIQNSSIKLITYDSLYGITLQLTLKPDVGHYHLDSQRNPTRIYLIKLGFISDTRRPIIIQGENIKESVTTEEFNQEAKIHRDIYDKSMEYYNKSIVPDVMKNASIIVNRNNDIITTISNKMNNPNDQIILNSYLRHFTGNIGIYIMKFLDGYNPFDKEIPRTGIVSEYVLHMYCKYHILLAILGYIHGDAHLGNIMLKKDSRNSITDVKIIDFGRIRTHNFNIRGSDDIDKDKISEIISYIKYNCDIVMKGRLPPEEWKCNKYLWNKLNQSDIERLTRQVIEWWRSNIQSTNTQRNMQNINQTPQLKRRINQLLDKNRELIDKNKELRQDFQNSTLELKKKCKQEKEQLINQHKQEKEQQTEKHRRECEQEIKKEKEKLKNELKNQYKRECEQEIEKQKEELKNELKEKYKRDCIKKIKEIQQQYGIDIDMDMVS